MPSYGGRDGPEHTTRIWFSLELLTSAVAGEEELCVAISLPSTLAEQPAAFSTDCNLCSSAPDTPANVEQQKSSLVMTSARSRVNRASGVNERHTLRIRCSATKQVLTVAVMWAIILRSASRQTPRSRTTDTGNTDVLPTYTGSLGIWCWRRAEERHNTSDLAGWWWWFDWSFACLIAPVVTNTFIILCINKHQLTQVHLENGKKWLREREFNTSVTSLTSQTDSNDSPHIHHIPAGAIIVWNWCRRQIQPMHGMWQCCSGTGRVVCLDAKFQLGKALQKYVPILLNANMIPVYNSSWDNLLCLLFTFSASILFGWTSGRVSILF